MTKNEDGLVILKSTDGTETFTLFYGRGPVFSNFFESEFILDGHQFVNAEQYFHYMKAVHFHDEAMQDAILKSSDPRDHKKLGRKVKNYDDEQWNSICYEYMKEALRGKFGQNDELKKKLLATKDTILVEASPRDRKWGIGMGVFNPLAADRKNWRGSNLLGQALNEVRDELMSETLSS